MRRRQVLAAVGTTLLSTGCLGKAIRANTREEAASPTSEPSLVVAAPPVSPGESASIEIAAQSVVNLRFTDVPDSDMTVEYRAAEFSTAPSVVWTRRPPTWEWSPPTDVDGTVPVSVPETVESDEYPHTIALQQEDSDQEVTETVTIKVQE